MIETTRRRWLSWGMTIGFVLAAARAAANPGPTPAPASSSSLDHPIALLHKAQTFYQGLRDYTCLFVKREQVNGQLLPENLIAMKVRCQPFSVHLRWVGPKTYLGQEVCYVAGRNQGMMRARSGGVLGAVGFVSLPVNDERVMRNSRHTITDAGIGNLLNQLSHHWQEARRTNQPMQVRQGEYEYNRRRCNRVEVVQPNRINNAYAYRCIVYFDKEHGLPVRIETYDWPKKNGPPQGDLLESYSYVDLRFNVGLGDKAFDY